MEELKLMIELIPESGWNLNLGKILKVRDWDKLRKEAYARFDHRCSICGERPTNSKNLHGHNVWEFDEEVEPCVQRIIDIIAVCVKCHRVIHFGLTQVQSDSMNANWDEIAMLHFIKINNCRRIDFDQYLAQATRDWNRRNQRSWVLDLTYLTDKGIYPKETIIGWNGLPTQLKMVEA